MAAVDSNVVIVNLQIPIQPILRMVLQPPKRKPVDWRFMESYHLKSVHDLCEAAESHTNRVIPCFDHLSSMKRLFPRSFIKRTTSLPPSDA